MIVFIILAVLLLFLIIKKKKNLNLPDVTLISGGVKTGKSTLGMHLARCAYIKGQIAWWFRHLFNKKIERPLFYSNIPLKCKYVPLTADILYMRERIVPKSVVFIDEASLLCDSMDFRDNEKNESVKKFFKLYGHISHGGKLFMCTHTPKDVHYNIKRSLAQYLFITRAIKWIPFFYVVNVRELIYCEENVQNIYEDDIAEDDTSYWILIPKSIWKKFDCYCYSAFVDGLPAKSDPIVAENLKTTEVLTFENKDN